MLAVPVRRALTLGLAAAISACGPAATPPVEVRFDRLESDPAFSEVVEVEGERRECARAAALRLTALPAAGGSVRFGVWLEPEGGGGRLVAEVRGGRAGASSRRIEVEVESGRPGWRDLFVEKPSGEGAVARIELLGGERGRTGCFDRPSFSSRRDRRRPDLLLVSIDTLRADALDAAPFLASRARTGLEFRSAWAASNWTLPSHAALMLSRPVHELALPLPGDREPHPGASLPAELPTLAERLRAGGYATWASTEGGYVHPAYGFARGFEVYGVTPSRAQGGSDPLAVHLERAERLLGEFRGDRPFFAFVHTYEVHDYFLNDASYHGRLRPEDRPWAERGNVLAQPLERRVFDFPPDFLRRLYAAGIERTDAFLERLVARLERASGERGLVVVVLSDHGESFGDRPGILGHHSSAIDEQTRIPLVAWGPQGLGPARIDRPVGLIDVAPSLLRAAGLEIPEEFRGSSTLLAEAPTANETPIAIAFDLQADDPGEWRLVRALVDGSRKTVREVRADGSGLASACFEVAERFRLLDEPAPSESCAALAAALDAALVRSAGSAVALRANAAGELSGTSSPGRGLAAIDAPGARRSPVVEAGGFRWRAEAGETLLLTLAEGELRRADLAWNGGPIPDGALTIEERLFGERNLREASRRAEVLREFEARLRALGYLR